MAVTTFWPEGNTTAVWPVTCLNGTGINTTPQNLSGNTGISLTMANLAIAPPNFRTMTGAATVTNAAQGVFNWTFSTADVAVPGTYEVVITVTFPGSVWKSTPLPFIIVQTQ